MNTLAQNLALAAAAPCRCLVLPDASHELAKEIAAAREAGECEFQLTDCLVGRIKVVWSGRATLEFVEGRKSYDRIMVARGYRLVRVTQLRWEWRKHER